jgi:hypothetical protein
VSILRNGKPFSGDPMKLRLKDGENMAIVFAPKGTDIPPVPFIKNLDNPLAGESGSAEVTLPPEEGDGSVTTAPPAEGTDTTDTTAPAAEGTDTTDTSAPAGDGAETNEDPASTSTSAP